MTAKSQRVLAVVAHADDELLGCGGTLRCHVLKGDTVHVVVAADCRTARDPDGSPELPHAARLVAERLGFHQPFFLGYCGMTLARVPELDRNRRVEEVVRDLHPHVVYTHHAGDINTDHQAIAAAVAVACRPSNYSWAPRRLLAFETPSSTEWGAVPFLPTVFCDIAGTLDDKLDALALYDAELREPPHPRSPSMLTARAAYWGQIAGLQAAEPFVLLREIRRAL